MAEKREAPAEYSDAGGGDWAQRFISFIVRNRLNKTTRTATTPNGRRWLGTVPDQSLVSAVNGAHDGLSSPGLKLCYSW